MRRGTTLLELLVVLTLVCLLVGLSALAAGRLSTSERDAAGHGDPITTARAEAVRTGKPVRIRGGSGGSVLLLPDGRVVGARLDPLTGASANAR